MKILLLPNKFVLVAIATPLLALNIAAAKVSPIENVSKANHADWVDVIDIVYQKGRDESVKFIQNIDTTGVGDANLDFYSITFDSAGETPSEIMADFRRNISEYIFKGTGYSVLPLNEKSSSEWNGPDPVTAVLVFTLASIDVGGGSASIEQGAVIVAEADNTSFVFTTVHTSGLFGAGDHPVSGSRAFGVVQNPDGSITLFTKGADRRKKDNVLFQTLGSERIFRLGADVWRRLMNNLVEVYRNRSPRNLVSHRQVEPEGLFIKNRKRDLEEKISRLKRERDRESIQRDQAVQLLIKQTAAWKAKSWPVGMPQRHQ